jgi:hypothetical protein
MISLWKITEAGGEGRERAICSMAALTEGLEKPRNLLPEDMNSNPCLQMARERQMYLPKSSGQGGIRK